MLLAENFWETSEPQIAIKDIYNIHNGSVYFSGGIIGKIIEFIGNYPMSTKLLHCTRIPYDIANDIKTNYGALKLEPVTCEYNPFITDHYAPEIIHFDIHIGYYPYSIRLIPKDEFA